MSLKKHTRVGAAVLCALALTAAACGKDGDTEGPGSDPGQGVKGGTLKLAGLRDLTHYDTNQAYEVRGWGYHLRATTRQMMSYETTTDKDKRDVPVPDIAEKDPEISSDGLTYTFTLRSGVKYANPTNREVVAGDFVRAIKRLCDPNGVSGGLSYFTATIKGMDTYCEKFAKVPTEKVDAVKTFVNGNEIEGLKADGDKKLVVTLKQKAGDFVNMMATPFTTPVPEEVLNYITDSAEFRKHLGDFANGPYTVESYTAKQSLKMKRNDNWDAKTDPLRKAYVDRIEIQLNAATAESVQQQIEAGTLDMSLRVTPPNAAAGKLEVAKDPGLKVEKDGGCVFYVAFNLHRNTTLQNKVVRQALNYAMDKRAVIQVLGGPRNGEPATQILTPVLLGYEKFDPYPTPDFKGDLNKAGELLSQAGVKNLKLDFIYDNTERNKNIVQVISDQFKKIPGVQIAVNPVPEDDATVYTTDPKAKNWDLYFAGWCPDWNGNGARTFFTPLLSDPGLKNYNAGGSYNYGGYDNPAVDTKVDEALAADPEAASGIWNEIDKLVMDDAPWIPVYTSNSVSYFNKRVKGYVYFPFSTSADITNIWVQ
ncbi:MAG TPA: ABC transporter substrate-binding protein [Frankiaceae bacterium]|jgi:peptide/nickel transport system substrate-binding protein|nr:ABC transporter substrate-binding protein [Frankiaceae bacterium]